MRRDVLFDRGEEPRGKREPGMDPARARLAAQLGPMRLRWLLTDLAWLAFAALGVVAFAWSLAPAPERPPRFSELKRAVRSLRMAEDSAAARTWSDCETHVQDGLALVARASDWTEAATVRARLLEVREVCRRRGELSPAPVETGPAPAPEQPPDAEREIVAELGLDRADPAVPPFVWQWLQQRTRQVAVLPGRGRAVVSLDLGPLFSLPGAGPGRFVALYGDGGGLRGVGVCRDRLHPATTASLVTLVVEAPAEWTRLTLVLPCVQVSAARVAPVLDCTRGGTPTWRMARCAPEAAESLLRQDDGLARALGVVLLGEAGPGGRARLLDLASAEGPLQGVALDALARGGDVPAAAVRRLAELAREPGGRAAARALGEVGAPAVPALVEVLAAPGLDPVVAAVVAGALAGASGPEAARALGSYVRAGPSPEAMAALLSGATGLRAALTELASLSSEAGARVASACAREPQLAVEALRPMLEGQDRAAAARAAVLAADAGLVELLPLVFRAACETPGPALARALLQLGTGNAAGLPRLDETLQATVPREGPAFLAALPGRRALRKAAVALTIGGTLGSALEEQLRVAAAPPPANVPADAWLQDIVTLASGQVHAGWIRERDEDQLQLEVLLPAGRAMISLPLASVAGTARRATPEAAFVVLSEQIVADDPEDHRELAAWCLANELTGFARTEAAAADRRDRARLVALGVLQQCSPCQGTGDVACATCRGTGRAAGPCRDCQAGWLRCPRCEGAGQPTCGRCGGNGVRSRSDGTSTPCTACRGLGRTECGRCFRGQRPGNVQCSRCDGTGQRQLPCEVRGCRRGKLDCPVCGGQGYGRGTALQFAGGMTEVRGELAAGGQRDVLVAVPEDGLYAFDTLGSTFDTVLRLLSEQGLMLAANDDGGPGLTSVLITRLAPGATYVVRVSGFGQAAGTFVLHANRIGSATSAAPAPAPGVPPPVVPPPASRPPRRAPGVEVVSSGPEDVGGVQGTALVLRLAPRRFPHQAPLALATGTLVAVSTPEVGVVFHHQEPAALWLEGAGTPRPVRAQAEVGARDALWVPIYPGAPLGIDAADPCLLAIHVRALSSAGLFDAGALDLSTLLPEAR